MNKTIHQFSITITPFKYPHQLEIRTIVICNGQTYTKNEILPDDHFEDLFSRLIDRAKFEIAETIKKDFKD